MACLGSKAGMIMLVLTEAGRQPSQAAGVGVGWAGGVTLSSPSRSIWSIELVMELAACGQGQSYS